MIKKRYKKLSSCLENRSSVFFWTVGLRLHSLQLQGYNALHRQGKAKGDFWHVGGPWPLCPPPLKSAYAANSKGYMP